MMKKMLMINLILIKTRVNPIQVMWVISAILLISVFGCSGDEKVNRGYEIPETFEHLPLGRAIGISPLSFIDTLNNGAVGEVYYITEAKPEDSRHIVNVPGMQTARLGEMTQIIDTLKSRKPLFLISLYGADARKLAQNSIANGITCFYVVGGSYKLTEVIRQQRLKIFPRPKIRKVKK